jgi:hypothetical protein
MYAILEINMNQYFHMMDGRVIAFETENEAHQYARSFYDWAMPRAMMGAPTAVMNLMNSGYHVMELPSNINYVLAKDL